jgi:hypothetical protein
MGTHAEAFARLLTLAIDGVTNGFDVEMYDAFSDTFIEWMVPYQIAGETPDDRDLPDEALIWLDELTGMAYCYERETQLIAIANEPDEGYLCIPIVAFRDYLRDLAQTPIVRYLDLPAA